MQPIPGWAPFGATHTQGHQPPHKQKHCRESAHTDKRVHAKRVHAGCSNGSSVTSDRFFRAAFASPARSHRLRSKPLRSPASTTEQRIPTHSQRPASPRPTQAHRTTKKENAAEERLDGVDKREEGHVLAAANGLVYTRAKESDKKMIDGGPQQPRENDWTIERFA